MGIYKKGRRKEYKIVEDFRKLGYDIVQRTAGSHSPIDIFAIKIKSKKIVFIQSKRTFNKTMDYINKDLKEKILEKHKDLNGTFEIKFIVL